MTQYAPIANKEVAEVQKKLSMAKRKGELRAQISDLESTKSQMISEMKTRPSDYDEPKSG